MMQQTHPDRDQLMEYALDEKAAPAALHDHVGQCDECAGYVKEIRSVRATVARFDTAIPCELESKILSLSRKKKRRTGTSALLENLYRNPFILGLAVAFLAVFFYILFIFVVQ
jgi:hypothetical protein